MPVMTIKQEMGVPGKVREKLNGSIFLNKLTSPSKYLRISKTVL